MIYIDEFIGHEIAVYETPNRDEKNIKGHVADETRNMIIIDVNGYIKKIPKYHRKFVIDGKNIIDGSLILFRPEDRLKEYRRILKKLGVERNDSKKHRN